MYAGNLKKLRHELRLSAQKLADSMGISLITMQNYELGKREPKYSFLLKLLTDDNKTNLSLKLYYIFGLSSLSYPLYQLLVL